MNILVTGAAGFIGSHFALRHSKQYPDDQVIIIDKLTYAANRSYLTPIKDNSVFIEGDVANQELINQIVTDYHVDTIVNFAAESHVDNSIADASPFLHTNVMGVQSLIEICKKHPHLLLVQVSTDEVYGDVQDDDPACTLSSPLRPSNPYSASKAAGDLLVGAAIRTYGIRARITRCTNNFGPHQAAEKFLPTIIRNALKNQPIPVYGEGKQKRDWLYVTDHTDAIELVLQQGEDGCTYLISADDERSNLETAKHVLHALSKPHDLIQFVSDRPGHDWRYALDSSSVKALGWKPCISFADGLQKTIEFYM